ncbi:MAG TPA: hypothetical protein VIS54_03225, partial [Psychromonas sp.]
MKRCIFLVTCYLFSSLSYAQCENDPQILGASYKIQQIDLKTGKPLAGLRGEQRLNFWRNHEQVLYEYQDQKISEKWNQLSNQQVRLVRYFDDFQRGIEYQPTEINHGQGEHNWGSKFQIIDPMFIKRLTLTKQTGHDCDLLSHYQQRLLPSNNANKETAQTVQLTWSAVYQLPTYFSIKNNGILMQWQLLKLNKNPSRVQQVIHSKQNYKLTDYSDIGDNESDPFLAKMINQGFVDHHESGFYDSQG